MKTTFLVFTILFLGVFSAVSAQSSDARKEKAEAVESKPATYNHKSKAYKESERRATNQRTPEAREAQADERRKAYEARQKYRAEGEQNQAQRKAEARERRARQAEAREVPVKRTVTPDQKSKPEEE